MSELLIKNGTIVDGTGEKRYIADILIHDKKIVKIGNVEEEVSDKIDATDLIVCPGFIESHGHTQMGNVNYPLNKIDQGVTTEITGHCGFSNHPFTPEAKENVMKTLGYICDPYKSDVDEIDFEKYVDIRESRGVTYNYASLVGAGTLRAGVIGLENREATKDELEKMCNLLETDMKQGAIGMSLGLVYLPNCYSSTEEIIALARVLSKYNGVLAVHMRDEGDKLIEAIEEVLEIAKKTKIKLMISHIKAILPRNWGKIENALKLIEEARNEGVEVWADSYFYPYGTTTIMALLPKWAMVGSITGIRERLMDSEMRHKITQETLDNFGVILPKVVPYKMISEKFKPFNATTFQEIAKKLNIEVVEVLFEILLHEDGAYILVDVVSENDIDKIAQSEFVLVGSDAMAHENLDIDYVNPRDFGAFPRYVRKFIYDKKFVSLEEGIRKMSGLTAEFYNLDLRGKLKENYFADIVIFDPETIDSNNSIYNPVALNKGINYVIINGEIQVDSGNHYKKNIGQVILNR